MALSKDDVRRIAKLAQLSIDDDELDRYTRELEEILEYVKQLDAVDTEGLEPTAQVTGLKNVTRKDEIIDLSVNREELLKNAPAQQDGYIKVRRVL